MTIVGEETVSVLTGLSEVILHVKNMTSMVAFYRDKLGFKVTYPTSNTDYSKESWITLDTGRCVLALHAGGKERHGETPSHRIVFQTKEIQATRTLLSSRGVELGQVGTRKETSGPSNPNNNKKTRPCCYPSRPIARKSKLYRALAAHLRTG